MSAPGAAGPVAVAAFYRFVPLPDFEALRAPLLERCRAAGLLGTILLAPEGINGTLAGPRRALEDLFARLGEDARLAGIEPRWSEAAEPPFLRLKVRLKKEIVSLGVEGLDPARRAGTYVAPEDWNTLISRPEVRLVDTRNDYEFHLGSFAGAEDPATRSFRDFPAWVDAHLDPARDRHVAMFCTGGIRCEKATALLRDRGFENVYHLEGGILAYLERIPEEQSLWRGDCFVFDDRVSVDHGLRPGDLEICPACRMPLTAGDRASPLYEENLCCPRCHDRLSPRRRAALRERARQEALAAARGERHRGPQREED